MAGRGGAGRLKDVHSAGTVAPRPPRGWTPAGQRRDVVAGESSNALVLTYRQVVVVQVKEMCARR